MRWILGGFQPKKTYPKNGKNRVGTVLFGLQPPDTIQILDVIPCYPIFVVFFYYLYNFIFQIIRGRQFITLGAYRMALLSGQEYLSMDYVEIHNLDIFIILC